jgi:hypothetical protein
MPTSIFASEMSHDDHQRGSDSSHYSSGLRDDWIAPSPRCRKLAQINRWCDRDHSRSGIKAAGCLVTGHRQMGPMETYQELFELAQSCMMQARLASTEEVADTLRQMAKEYQARAAKLGLGKLPDIGEDDPFRWYGT